MTGIMERERNDLPLSPYRVLDLTNDQGYFCGKILADLGADVIKVEPPGGDPGRNVGPFYHDIPDREKSLFFLAYNTNKRSVTLNIETPERDRRSSRGWRSPRILLLNLSPREPWTGSVWGIHL